MAMLNHVMARGTAAICNNYLRGGPGALSTPDQDFLSDMDKIGATLFHAFGAAKNGSLPAASASDEDWSLLADAFINAGGTPAEMNVLPMSARNSKVSARQSRNYIYPLCRCRVSPGDTSKPLCSMRSPGISRDLLICVSDGELSRHTCPFDWPAIFAEVSKADWPPTPDMHC
ncbi:hypothetical protein ACFSOZ_29090 [Mesorhizobium newzealandense]|uniref:Uncharacterized protein n=1 Tax=Mesorhizobium newzealandense TaxID=1300302 RepID=A0ABW4UG59_9HYPH